MLIGDLGFMPDRQFFDALRQNRRCLSEHRRPCIHPFAIRIARFRHSEDRRHGAQAVFDAQLAMENATALLFADYGPRE